MDSRLLNVFHDVPFDGNYGTYGENDADFWSSGSETMGLRLTETLDGILPIAGIDDVANSIYASANDFQLEHKDDVGASIPILQGTSALIYDNYAAEQHLAAGGTIEIVTDVSENGDDGDDGDDVDDHEEENDEDSDSDSDSDSDDDDEDNDDDEDSDDDDEDNGQEKVDENELEEIGVDERSQHSNSTFRSRTDSSSIADYESSDYDDDTYIGDKQEDEENDEEGATTANDSFSLMTENVSGLLTSDDLILNTSFKLPMEMDDDDRKNRSFSSNTIGSDVDGLGLQIDASTFDLADFITQDDFALNTPCLSSPVACVMTPQTNGLNLASPTTAITARAASAAAPALVHHAEPVMHVIDSCHNESDSEDSDAIVDVETIEMESEDEEQMAALTYHANVATAIAMPVAAAPAVATQVAEEVAFVDNVKSDPSWSPKQVKKIETSLANEVKPQQMTAVATTAPAAFTTQQQPSPAAHNFGRNFSMVPSKRQCDFLKGKYGSGRGSKNTTTTQQQQRNAKLAAAKKMPAETNAATATATAVKKPTASNNFLKVPSKGVARSKKPPTPAVRRLGMGKGGKNLALIKHDHQSISEQSSDENNTPVKAVPVAEVVEIATVVAMPLAVPAVKPLTPPKPQPVAVKRKLNLEEYKKRRSDTTTTTAALNGNKMQTYKIPKLDIAKTTSAASTSNAIAPNTPTKHSEAVTSVVRTLKAQQQQRPQVSDPITEARNKVLRMQELKRAQQLKIIDSAVSAKVPRVTKLLPLRDIIKETDAAAAERRKTQNVAALQIHNDFEEIIIVSASCNTDISMPPNGGGMLPQLKNASRSLLKSSALLYNISNTFQKVQQKAASDSSVKFSNNSLLVSIQDAVVKQTAPTAAAAANAVINAAAANATAAGVPTKSQQHGEDKIIMHLRKDRVRQRTLTIATQTEFAAEFPPLPLPKAIIEAAAHKSRERTRRKYRKRNISLSSASSSSASSGASSDERDSVANGGGTGAASYRSRSRSADSCSSAASLAERDATATANAGGYSSRSSRRHRSSVSSSYSESDRRAAAARSHRQRRSSYKQHRSKKQSRDTSSSSMSDYSGRSSRSRTRSRSPHYRQRSRSPRSKRNVGNASGHPQQSKLNNNSFVDQNVSQPAVEERRIVYVGRIEQETTKEMLRRKFLAYGTIRQITIHYKDTGMKYGFVTYERSEDAFRVIDTSARDDHINMYDISFGGRRAFCRASYADLDNAGINNYESHMFPKPPAPPREEDSFEALLKKVKAKMNASKPAATADSGRI